MHGPIWIRDKDNWIIDSHPLIDNDKLVQSLKQNIAERYDSYFHFNYNDLPLWFDEEQERADKEIMLEWIDQLTTRLKTINDGSYIIEDLETERLKSL